jgi:hypothetical protein
MAAWAEMVSNGTVRREKPLRMSGRFEPSHCSFSLAGGLMGILRTIIETAVLSVLYTQQHFLFRRAIAP